jgi:hypothetical protein
VLVRNDVAGIQITPTVGGDGSMGVQAAGSF